MQKGLKFFFKKFGKRIVFPPIFAVPKNEVVVQVTGFGSVVQLVRMPPCHGGGRGSESRPVRKKLHRNVRLFCCMGFSQILKTTTLRKYGTACKTKSEKISKAHMETMANCRRGVIYTAGCAF